MAQRIWSLINICRLRFFFVAIVVFFVWMSLRMYYDANREFGLENWMQQRIIFLTSKKESKEEGKRILFATTFWESNFNITEIQSEQDLVCSKQCIFSRHSSTFIESDALLFHGHKGDYHRSYPRLSNQIWVFLWWETGFSKYRHEDDALFNWTLTFRSDSDIVSPYGALVLKQNATLTCSLEFQTQRLNHDTNLDFYANKILLDLAVPSKKEDFRNRHFAAWIVSRCKSKESRREDLVAELRNYVPVHIYGKCGDNPKYFCRKSRKLSTLDCREQISSSYLFYLSFENSICEDYVTEKFFHTLTTEMVPVVWGGANYKDIFPPKSYISLTDFESIESLAKYLVHLSENKEEYYAYFEWRKNYCLTTSRAIAYCDLCKKLYSMDSQPNTKTYDSISKWWIQSRNPNQSYTCINPDTLPYFTKRLN